MVSLVAPVHNVRWHGPDHDRPLGAARHDASLVRRNGAAGDRTAVAHADVLADPLVVLPKLQEALLPAGDVVRAALRDGQGGQLALFGALEHPDGLAVEGVPVADLPVAAGCEQLRLIGVINN